MHYGIPRIGEASIRRGMRIVTAREFTRARTGDPLNDGRTCATPHPDHDRLLAEKAAEVERIGGAGQFLTRVGGRRPTPIRCVEERLVFPSLDAAASYYKLDAGNLHSAVQSGRPI